MKQVVTHSPTDEYEWTSFSQRCNVSGVHVSTYVNTIIVHAAASDIALDEILEMFEAVFTGG